MRPMSCRPSAVDTVAVASLSGKDTVMIDPSLVTIEPRHAAVVTARALPADEVRTFFDTAFHGLGQALGQQGQTPAGPAFAWFPSPPGETIDVRVGHQVGPDFVAADPVGTCELPGGRAAQLVHEGSYDNLGSSWQRLVDWTTEQGLIPSGELLEEYLTEPTPDADPADMRTRLSLFVTD